MPLREFWYIAAESRSLKRRPLALVILGESIVLFRDDEGRVSALEDRCAHRNAPLSAGRTANSCIECPYHGWRYDGQGGCVHIPSLGEGAKLPRHTVRSYPVQEQDGYVWVYMGEDAPTTVPFKFPHFGEQRWSTFRMRTRFQTDVEACLENFLDCPHTAYVHKGWFRNHDTSQLKAFVRTSDGVAEAEFENEPVSDSVITRLFYPRGHKPRHTDRFRVERFNPGFIAAPFGPASTQRVCFRVAIMWARSASSKVRGFQPSAPGPGRGSSATGTFNSGPELRMTARSITFSNSRMFPGQLWLIRASMLCWLKRGVPASRYSRHRTRSGLSAKRNWFDNA